MNARAPAPSVEAVVRSADQLGETPLWCDRVDVHEPDVDAFRTCSNRKYLESPLSGDWPEGMLDKINAL